MRYVCFAHAIFLSCIAAAQTTTPFSADVVQQLERAIKLENNGQVKEAERSLLNLIRTTPSGSIEQGASLNNLAVLYAGTERYEDAERFFLRGIRLVETLAGPLSEQLLVKMKLHLAALYIEMGRGADAQKLNVPALAQAIQSPEEQARAKSTLGGLALLRNELDTAERVYGEALSFWMEPSRAEDSGTEIASILNNLGIVALRRGRIDLARQRLEQSLETWQRTVGPQSPNVAKAMTNVAEVCIQLKQYDDAAMWLARATPLARDTFGESHPFTVAVQFAHADALKKAGRKPEASQISRLASQARKMMRNPSSSYTVDYRDLKK